MVGACLEPTFSVTTLSTRQSSDWEAAEARVAEGIDEHYDHLAALAACVELQPELQGSASAAEDDQGFDDAFDEWVWFLSEAGLLLAVHRCCDDQGLLAPWPHRFDALHGLPEPSMGKLKFFFRACPNHVMHLVAHWVAWMVKFEALQRHDSTTTRG